jgi:hypothetical protein
MSFSFGKSKKGYNKFKDEELKEFDVGAVALNAAIEAAQLTAQTSGKIYDRIALLELLLQRTPGNKVYTKELEKLKELNAAAAAASAAAAAEEENYESDSGSVVGSEGSEGFAGVLPDEEEDKGGKKSRYSRKSKSKSKYSRKSKSKSKYSRKSKSKSKYSRKSKSKYSRKY